MKAKKGMCWIKSAPLHLCAMTALLVHVLHIPLSAEPLYFDSFSLPNKNWSEMAGYRANQQSIQSLEAAGRSEKGYQLKNPLPPNADVQVFIKMPDLDACAGFILSNNSNPDGEKIFFSISGKKCENPKKGVLCERVIHGQVMNIFSSALEIQEADWHGLQIKRDFAQFHVSIDGKSITSFKFLEENVHISLWSNSFGKCLFDEFQVALPQYFSRDFPTGLENPGEPIANWTVVSGLWSRLYLPSQKAVVLHQSAAEDSRILLAKPCPEDFLFKCRIKTEDPGQIGLILDHVSEGEYLLLQFNFNEKNNIEVLAHTGARLPTPVDNTAFPFYRGIWHEIQLERNNNQFHLAIDEREVLQFKAGAPHGGRLGLLTAGTTTGVFMDPQVIASGPEHTGIYGGGDLNQNQILSIDWQQEKSLSVEPGQDGLSAMAMNLPLTDEGTVGGLLVPGEDFTRFSVHLAGAASAYELHFVKNEAGQFHAVILHGDKSTGGASGPASPLNALYRDDRNRNYQEFYSAPLPPFDQLRGLPFLVAYDRHHMLSIIINNLRVLGHKDGKNSERNFNLEFGGKGHLTVQNFSLQIYKSAPPASLFGQSNEEQYQSIDGLWHIKGGKIDDESMKKPGSIVTFKKSILQHGQFELQLNRVRNKGGSFKLRLGEPGQTAVQHEVEFDTSGTDEIVVKHKDEKGRVISQPVSTSYPVHISISRQGSTVRWSLGDRQFAEMHDILQTQSQMSLQYMQGRFSLENFSISQFPDFASTFTNPQRFAEDASKWNNNSFMVTGAPLGLPGAIIGSKGAPVKYTSPIIISLKQALPAVYAFSMDIDYELVRDRVKHEVRLFGTGFDHKVVVDVGKLGCKVTAVNGDKNDKSRMFQSKRIKLLVQQGAAEWMVLVNGETLAQVAVSKPGTSTLAMILSNYNQENIRFSNAFFYTSN